MKDHESSEVRLLRTPSERENGVVSDCGINSPGFNSDGFLDSENVRKHSHHFHNKLKLHVLNALFLTVYQTQMYRNGKNNYPLFLSFL